MKTCVFRDNKCLMSLNLKSILMYKNGELNYILLSILNSDVLPIVTFVVFKRITLILYNFFENSQKGFKLLRINIYLF